jgi:hypothetical protein
MQPNKRAAQVWVDVTRSKEEECRNMQSEVITNLLAFQTTKKNQGGKWGGWALLYGKEEACAIINVYSTNLFSFDYTAPCGLWAEALFDIGPGWASYQCLASDT